MQTQKNRQVVGYYGTNSDKRRGVTHIEIFDSLKREAAQSKVKNYRNRLKFYEQKHTMKSKDFIKAFNRGTLGDDAECLDWVFVYETYSRLKNQEKLVEGIIP